MSCESLAISQRESRMTANPLCSLSHSILQTVFGLLSIVGVLFIRECSLTERAAQHPADEDAEAA